MHIIVENYNTKKKDYYLDNIITKEYLLFNDPNPDEYDETYYSIKYNPDLELTFNDDYIIIPRYFKNIKSKDKILHDKCIFCSFLEDCDKFGCLFNQNDNHDDIRYFFNQNYNCINLLSDSDSYTHFYKTYFLHEISESTVIISDSYRLNEYYYIWKLDDYNAIINLLNTLYRNNYNTIFNIMLNYYKDDELAFKKIQLNGTYKMKDLFDTVCR